MMKYVILAAFLGLTLAAPQQPSTRHADITIVRSESVQNPDDGSYRYAYENSDGTKVEQSGALKQIGNEKGIAIQGAFSYNDEKTNTPVQLTYIADENGFNAEGQHLPKHFQSELHPEIAAALVELFRIAEQQRAEAARNPTNKQ